MTHFPVVVCVSERGELEKALAPFDEELSGEWHPGGDHQAKWDWWVIGGRWSGYFTAREGHQSLTITGDHLFEDAPDAGLCDGGPKAALDLAQMRNESAARARNTYQDWLKAIEGTPEARTWAEIRDESKTGDGYDIEKARQLYAAQPRVAALKETSFDFSMEDAIELFQMPGEVYIARAIASAVPGWAVLTVDGRWMEPGQMGWWGMNTASTGDRIGYWEAANAYIDELPDTTWLIAVDCHI